MQKAGTHGGKGKWIVSELEPDTAVVLRKRFTAADGKVSGQKGRLYLCGLGVYEVYLNGEKVGREYLALGYHSYDFHLQVQAYDVTEYLREGENEIQIWLGDGWFRGRLGFDGGYTNLYGDKCYAIAELYVGEELVAMTDSTWESKESPVVFSNIYDGEIYDANVEKKLYDADGWKGVREKEPVRCDL